VEPTASRLLEEGEDPGLGRVYEVESVGATVRRASRSRIDHRQDDV